MRTVKKVYLGFWSGNLFLIAPFPDLCLLVPFMDGPVERHNSGISFRLVIIGNRRFGGNVLSFKGGK